MPAASSPARARRSGPAAVADVDAATVDDDAAWAALAAENLRAQDAGFALRFDADDDIERLLLARVIAVDGLVRQTWSRTVPADAALTLFAVGGYGRGELVPRPDIDLLVVVGEHASADDTELGRASRRESGGRAVV